MISKRSSGVLMHLTSLPSDFGIGDLGQAAYRFADLLSESDQSYWQVLPVNPVGSGNSPYNPRSVFAGSPLLISPEVLQREELLPELPEGVGEQFPSSRVDYGDARLLKKKMLQKAYELFKQRKDKAEFDEFSEANSRWLDDYSLYSALKEESGLPWYLWPKELRDRDPKALGDKGIELKDAIDSEKYVQFEFFRQWHSLKEYCADLEIALVGDVPFYVAYDSCDTWANREIFKVDIEGRPLFVGGVPPDYFSETGQLWGNPVYDWKRLKAQSFSWWTQRLKQTLELFDLVRLDHFRGYVAYWQIPARANTAQSGEWVDTPWESFFEIVREAFPAMPFVAEDLGVITSEVRDAIARLGLPGMNVLLFAFDGSPENPYLPEKHSRNSVVYTGTHDTNTVRGWFNDEASAGEKKRLFEYVGRELSDRQVSWEFIRLALSSVAGLSVIPAQDILSLGSETRMNHPSVSEGNWEWRVKPEQLASDSFRRLREMTDAFGRR